MEENKHFILFFIFALLPIVSFSQTGKLIHQADSLHRNYEFQASRQLYQSVIKSSTDSTEILFAREKLLLSENGINMLKFSSSPIVRANRMFSSDEFLLHIQGLEDKSWIKIPNAIVSEGLHKYYTCTYYPQDSKTVLFSQPDDSGSWNIYTSTYDKNSMLWSDPQILSENLCSDGDEIFPLLSENGDELYFSSNGHYGMGGYDLYVSRWDENSRKWSDPENLGFPYSSTADDILFYNSPDGQYSIYASNRYCEEGKIAVIVSEFDKIHVKKEIRDLGSIRQIAQQKALSSDELLIEDIESRTVNNNMDAYSSSIRNMRKLEDELKTIIKKLNESREIYASTTNENDKIFIAEAIEENEIRSNQLRIILDSAKAIVQKLELEFLNQGIIPVVSPAEGPTGENDEYIYPEHRMGEIKHFVFEKPVEKFDYTFKVLKTAQLAEDMTLPPTLVYQIQMMVTNKKVPLSKLKGLSPIYETRNNGRYYYRVGRFSSYSEAYASLNTVRKKGYSKAYIVAYNKGKSLSIKNARELEKSIRNSQKYQIVFKGYPEELPMSIISTVRSISDKEITKIFDGREYVYVLGPFSQKTQAQEIVNTLNQLEITGLSIQSIK